MTDITRLVLLLAVGALNTGARGGRITPYKAVIEYKGNAFCVGSVIDTVWILTAARCVMNHTVSYITVRLGSYGNGTVDGPGGGLLSSVRAFFVHPKYDPETSQRDIALLRLGVAVKFSASIAAIPLVKPGYGMEEGTRCTIPSAGVDFKAKLWSRERCESVHPSPQNLTDDALCAKIVAGNSSSSSTSQTVVDGSKPINQHQGQQQLQQTQCDDAQHRASHQHKQSRFMLGSPLVCEGKQVALVSHAARLDAAGSGQCNGNHQQQTGRDLPNVFTDVAFADQWISSHTMIRRKRRPGTGKRRPAAKIRRKLSGRNGGSTGRCGLLRIALIGVAIGWIN